MDINVLFQFLIGRLVTYLKKGEAKMKGLFQFLIGRLVTDTKFATHEGEITEFQFLIGRLVTCGIFLMLWALSPVSPIPHR